MQKSISKIFFLVILVFILSIGTQSCKHYIIQSGEEQIDTICNPDIVYFANDVLPILISNCAVSGCHDPATHEKGITLSTYDDVINSDVLDPGRADHSDMIEVVTETGDDRMPPAPRTPLTAEEIATLTTWINQGATNNICDEGLCDTLSVTYSVTISAILNTYCLGCHAGASPSGDLDFTTYDGISTVAADGRLYGSVAHLPGFVSMPLGGSSITECNINQIRIWVENGYADN